VRYFASVFAVWLIAVFGRAFLYKPPLPCANTISCKKPLALDIENNATGTFLGKKVMPPKVNLADEKITQPVLGTTTGAKKVIYVDLTKQTLYAYEGNNLVYTFRVSTGRWAPTVTGTFHIYVKLRSTLMAGGEGATAYYLPNVQYTMYFYRDYAIHAAYWHDNFGFPMSHGCVNERLEDSKKLYEWAGPQTTGYTTYATADNPGTDVIIYGQAPVY